MVRHRHTATSGQRAEARKLFAAHLAACRRLGMPPSDFHEFLSDVIASPPGLLAPDPGERESYEPSWAYSVYASPASYSDD